MQPTYSKLNWAYQLHYSLGFRTHRRRKHFADPGNAEKLDGVMAEICQQHDYHLLGLKTHADHFRCLLSLRPEYDLSTVIRNIKTNSAREFGKETGIAAPIWARGYLARSVGRVNISTVKKYIDHQSEHHGYSKRHFPPVYRYRVECPSILTATHSVFDLNHHLVVATRVRASVFDSMLGQELVEYWLKVAEKYGFAIDRITIVPDHAHLLIRNPPKLSVETCAMALLNNGEYFICKKYPLTLSSEDIDQLWQPSAYVGSTGKVSTALVKAWLNAPL